MTQPDTSGTESVSREDVDVQRGSTPEATVLEATTGPFSPIDMRITVNHICGKQIEQCCNYEITGRNSAGLTIMLPPVTQRLMTHMRDVAD